MPRLSDATLWNPMRESAARRRTALAGYEDARTFALLNMALSDAGVCCDEHENITTTSGGRSTVIRGGDTDGNRQDRRGSVWSCPDCRAVLPQLSLRPREHELRRTRSARALRLAADGHSIVVSSPSGAG